MQTESFTSGSTREDGWLVTPEMLKRQGDCALAKGVNRFCLHTFAHQPWKGPIDSAGMTMGPWGSEFNRANTLWPYFKPWIAYLARANFLLQQGFGASDVLYVGDDDPPVRFTPPAIPYGYQFDAVDSFHFRREAKQDAGMTVLSSGQRYRFVVRTNDAFTPKGFASDFFVEERLQQDVAWLHRRLEDGTELYFVANLADDARTFTATFRAQAESVELWDAIDGSIVGAEAKRRDDGRTDVQLALGPGDSVFVLFRSISTPGRGRARSPGAPHGNNPVLDLSRDWRVTFQSNRGAPAYAHFPALRSLSDHADTGIRCFSGEVLYEKSFSIALHGGREGAAATERCDSRRPAVLELGRVCDACRVELNGRDLGIVWRKPWRVDVTDALMDGTNTLRITVANRWINRMIGDERVAAPYPGVWKSWRDKLYLQAEFPPSFLAEGRSPEGRYAYSTLRTRRKDDALKSAGLIGPVKLTIR